MTESLLVENLCLLTMSQCLESEYAGRGKRSDLYKAFMVVASAGNSVRSELETMLQTGTPSGRIYAAILLRQIDLLAGENALKQLQGDRDPVRYIHGCSYEEREVGELITEIFQGSNLDFPHWFPPCSSTELTNEESRMITGIVNTDFELIT